VLFFERLRGGLGVGKSVLAVETYETGGNNLIGGKDIDMFLRNLKEVLRLVNQYLLWDLCL
jgi:hypothetical protein